MTAPGRLDPSWLDSLLQRLGVRARVFHALVHAYLLMDFRNQQFARATASGPKALITPLFWVVGQNLLMSGILCGVLFARVDAFFFVLLSLGTSMLVMATSIIVEFNEVVLDPSDLEVIGHHPVPVRTYSAARVTNLMGYVLLITASMNVFPAVVGLGLADTGWHFLPGYLLAAATGNLLAAGAVILLYSWLSGGRPGRAIREMLAWTQVALILLFVYGGQLVLRDPTDRLEMLAYRLPEWVVFLPPGWLAHFVTDCAGGNQAVAWAVLAATLLGTAGVWVAVVWRLSIAYAGMQPGSAAWDRATVPSLPQPGQLAGPLVRRLTRPGAERTAFWLCWTMLRRDHQLRMRSWPALGVVVAVVAVGLLSGQLGDPLTSPGPKCALSLASIYLLAVPMPTIVHNLRFSRDHRASWVLQSAPIADRPAFAEGIRKAVTYRILVPVLVLLAFVLIAKWGDVPHALAHVGVGWLVVVAAGYATVIGTLRKLPFSSPTARGETFGPIALLAAAVSGAALFLAVVHYHLVRWTPAFAAYIIGLTLLVLILRRIARQVMLRRFAVEVSHE
ncbi:MAG: hypothetical protein ACYTG0_31935 [Planctomycetota bacterium]|jgi:hypothetical protein